MSSTTPPTLQLDLPLSSSNLPSRDRVTEESSNYLDTLQSLNRLSRRKNKHRVVSQVKLNVRGWSRANWFSNGVSRFAVSREAKVFDESHLRFREVKGGRELRSFGDGQVLLLAELFLEGEQLLRGERRPRLAVRLVLPQGAPDGSRPWTRQPQVA